MKTNAIETSTIEARPVADCTAAEVADAVTRSFEGYVVPLRFTPEAYERRFRAEHLDPYASRLYLRDGALTGVMLISRRGWTRRVSAMGFVPAVRGQGVGRWALGEVIAEARAQGERAVVLEVIEQNAPAVALYTRMGFLRRRRLVGYRWEPGKVSDSADTLDEIDPLEFSRIAAREGEPDLPWMLAAETLSAAAPPARAYALEDRAYALVSDAGGERIALAAFVVPRAHRRQGWGSRLLQALRADFPGRSLLVSPVVPEDLAPGLFARLGWERQGLSQWEMRLEIAPAPHSSRAGLDSVKMPAAEETAMNQPADARTPEQPEPPLDPVDEASAESFPASDPPSWEPLHSGPPGDHPDGE